VPVLVPRLLAALALTGLMVSGCNCSRGDDRLSGPFEEAPFLNAYPPGDELAEGQHYFVFETWGLEERNEWPPVSFMLQLMEDDPGTFGNQFANYGFIPDLADDLPYGFKRGTVDPEKIAPTCALCHMAELEPGRMWAGLPNTNLDIGRFRADVSQRWQQAGNPPLVSRRNADKLRSIGRGREDMSHHTYPLAAPVDFPSLFNAGERTALNALGTSGDLRTEVWRQLYLRGSGKSLLDGTPITLPTEGKVQALTDFLRELKPTAPPEPGNNDQVLRGREVFAEARCNACHFPGDTAAHGTALYLRAGPELIPGEDDTRPDGSVSTSGAVRVWLDGQEAEPLPDEVDPDIAIEAGQALDEREFDWALLWFQVQHGMKVGDSAGYRVPDLTGLWLTAPYLHNGSVENLGQLLTPDNRQGGPWGRSSRGHAFGQELEGSDKQALIAYLLTL
jgi:mono/diheme cytochrome c family protein